MKIACKRHAALCCSFLDTTNLGAPSISTAGDDSLAGATTPFRVVLRLSSNQRQDLAKRRLVQGVRLDNDVGAGEPSGVVHLRPNSLCFVPAAC